MIFRRKSYPYPKVRYRDRDYYVINITKLNELIGENVKVEGYIKDKVKMITHKAGLPWSLESRVIEKDHYHTTYFNLEGGVVVEFRGIALLRSNEHVVIYGKVVGRNTIEAHAIETENAIYVFE